MAGVNIVRILYKGGGPAVNDVVAGQVHMTFASAGSSTNYISLEGVLKRILGGE